MTQGLNIDKLNTVMAESYPDKVLKNIDGRTTTNAPWQRNLTKTEEIPHTTNLPRKMAEGLGEDEDDEHGDDINALDDDYDEEAGYDEDADEEYDEVVDED